jgi:EAL domain-containing protein (putative c-di-GMP-specific phosphodiesterase class I)
MQNAFKKPLRSDHEDIVITLSAGIALFPGDGKEPEVLIQNAEVALAKAKAGGINMYQFFTSEMNKRATEFIDMQRHLFKALEFNEFVMHYQPYFDSTTREMVGMEALIRWNSSKFGLVSPGLFIPILEETGMIIDVGKWIIHTVCRQIKEWMDKGYKPSIVPVYVNLSLAQFAQRDLLDFIEKTIVETGIYPSFLGFEITESIFMQDVQHTQAVLETLRQKGISVNIDDFGTGYSSLSNLKRLPVNNLKIDISFIRDIADNPDDVSLVITIISMAHNLDLKTIAEGVETEEQWKILRILKCDMVQGFYFSKPVPVQDVEKFFKQQ